MFLWSVLLPNVILLTPMMLTMRGPVLQLRTLTFCHLLISARSSLWPSPFILPGFSYDVQLKLHQGNSAFWSSGKVLTPDPKLKSEEMINFKAYPSDSEFNDVAEALVDKHSCLKEQGSESSYSGWEMSLKFKLANYRRQLRGLGCPDLMPLSANQKESIALPMG